MVKRFFANTNFDGVNGTNECVLAFDYDALAAELSQFKDEALEWEKAHILSESRARALEADRDQISLTLDVAKADRDKWFNRARDLEAELANERLTNKAWLRENAPGGWIDDLRVRMGKFEALLRRVAPTYGMSTLAQEIASALETGANDAKK